MRGVAFTNQDRGAYQPVKAPTCGQWVRALNAQARSRADEGGVLLCIKSNIINRGSRCISNPAGRQSGAKIDDTKPEFPLSIGIAQAEIAANGKIHHPMFVTYFLVVGDSTNASRSGGKNNTLKTGSEGVESLSFLR